MVPLRRFLCYSFSLRKGVGGRILPILEVKFDKPYRPLGRATNQCLMPMTEPVLLLSGELPRLIF